MALFSSKPKTPVPKPDKPIIAEPTSKRQQADILVAEVGQQLAPWAEEAVILYATGRTGDATAVLNQRILDNPESRDATPWLMLFDIYEASDQRALFEDLGLDFAVRFERSPPLWAPPMANAETHEDRILKIEFGPSFSAIDKARLQHSLLEAIESDIVCLDFSHTPAPPPAYAHSIIDCIRKLRAMRKPIDVISGPAFIVRLNSACSSDRMDQNGWHVLLAVEELMDDPNGFDEIAVAYAVRFEISPPSFVPPIKPHRAPEPQAVAAPSPDTFIFEGAIDSKYTTQIQALIAFAGKRTRVTADLARLTRIEFTSSGLVLDALIRLKDGGCQVIFKDCNSLVLALMQMLGADQYATLLPRKRV